MIIIELLRCSQYMIVVLILDVQRVESVSLTCHFVLTKLYREHSICASSQISINLTKCFTEEFLNWTMIRQELPMEAILVVSSARNTHHSYKVTIHFAYRFQKTFFLFQTIRNTNYPRRSFFCSIEVKWGNLVDDLPWMLTVKYGQIVSEKRFL